MRLPFLDREEEARRLRGFVQRPGGGLAVLYGRRRCGKSRLLLETLAVEQAAYYVGDERESALQRAALATEIARLLPGFDSVTYPGWDPLLERFWSEASSGQMLVLDEFPALVAAARELPSLLQKRVDRASDRSPHLVLTGSSQRMMHGLVLDRSAPLFGRAVEILKISPLRPFWVQPGLRLRKAIAAIEAHAVWGGIPRYWELASDHPDLMTAIRELVLSPLGVLYDEPSRLLLDDLRDTAQASSVMSLIGRGSHRSSEIAGRMGKPATSLSRQLQLLVDLELVRREVPFGFTARTTKRTLYRIADPFLRFWFRFVEPNRSLLEARRIAAVVREIGERLPMHVAENWEELARASVPHLEAFGKSWGEASRFWGAGLDRRPVEVDLVAESEDGSAVLLGEAKWQDGLQPGRLLSELRSRASRLPFIGGRRVYYGLWLKAKVSAPEDVQVFTPRQVLDALR